MNAPVDAAIRERALDPQTSFIVQAPAGSGKTELLTRRVLTLLAIVDEPENILSITFTKKAASEMRQRVVHTLERAASGIAPANDYEAEGLALAKVVLERDRERDWQIIRNPQRLNLRTIDSLATQLAHRLPVTSTLGAPTGIIENANELYREAAARFIDANIEAIPHVLLQMGNKLELAQSLFADLLAKRDQWKRYVIGVDIENLRNDLEDMLSDLVESRLINLCHCIPLGLNDSLPRRLRYAAEYLLIDNEGDIDSLSPETQSWIDLQELPGSSLADLNVWDGIGQAIFTSDRKSVRKRLTRSEGFPAKGAAKELNVPAATLVEHKQDMVNILDSVREETEFLEALSEVCKLPFPRYQDDQWALLSELLDVLPSLIIELQLLFAEVGAVDFPELSQRAEYALGKPDNPTDLALAMDLSLQHVLVDEFQDTSQTQFRLFSQLVGGWQQGDGRTFFAVGDPMQSIYRFREGDVALFGLARDEGIGPVELEPLTLSVNFRAAPDVIGWVNDSFSEIFPKRADPDSGAVPYSASDAHLKTEGAVRIHPLIDADKSDEAETVAQLAARAIENDKDHQVAILVRSRAQAGDIFAALRQHSLSYQSVDMDLVGERAVVKDLMSLCLALRYPHDRLHWLSLLRAPFVGLSLHDLHAIMDDAKSKSVIELLKETERHNKLSEDGQQRVARFLSVIEPALKRASRTGLMPWVESVWLQLGGPVVCRDDIDANAAERAIRSLVSLEVDGKLWQKSDLDNVIKSLFAQSPDESDCQIQVMTLHKSKGLEFDTVILPALDRQTRADGAQLLNWFESTLDGRSQLLMAPLEQSGLAFGSRDKIIGLVRKARERCDEQEKLRLLYVACTRAKKELHLVARAQHSAAGDLRNPVSSSLLKPLWPLLEPLFIQAEAEAQQANAEQAADGNESVSLTDQATNNNQGVLESAPQLSLAVDEDQPEPSFERLSVDTDISRFNVFEWPYKPAEDEIDDKSVEFQWAGRDARDIGTVIHMHLQLLADRSESDRTGLDEQTLKAITQRQLKNLGMQDHRLDAAVERVLQGVRNTLDDERGQWILTKHQDARTEWALTMPLNADEESHRVQKVVIDRTFVDESGTRWIVDFKTGDHRGGQLDEFLDNEQKRYADQLNRYADIMSTIEKRPIRVGLYFPMFNGWREWQPPQAAN